MGINNEYVYKKLLLSSVGKKPKPPLCTLSYVKRTNSENGMS